MPALDLLVIDEASRVTDDLMVAVMPMIATTGGTIMALSTPAGQKGWFFEEASSASTGGGRWAYWKITADMCPRIPQDHLDEMLDKMGEAVFEQEYFCQVLCWATGRYSAWGRLTLSWPARREREESAGLEAVSSGRLYHGDNLAGGGWHGWRDGGLDLR